MGIFLLLTLIYSIGLVYLLVVWQSIKPSNPSGEVLLRLTVVIPVRNEERSIGVLLHQLSMQTYPKEKFEVIVVNDHSTDHSVDIVQQSIRSLPIRIKLLHQSKVVGSPKKQAIDLAIRESQGEIVVTTDGDCEVKRDWLDLINRQMNDDSIQMLLGPVRVETSSFLSRLNWVEFTALQGMTAALNARGINVMGNAANLAYRKSAFQKVRGFMDNLEVASGDDEFLVKKVSEEFGPRSVAFIKDPKAIVSTTSPRSLSKTFHQKVRWASKWKHQKSPISKVLPVLIAVFNIVPFAALVYSLVEPHILWLAVVIWCLKFLVDASFVSSVALFFGHTHSFMALLVLEIIYPFYALFIGLASTFGKYTWKGRKFS